MAERSTIEVTCSSKDGIATVRNDEPIRIIAQSPRSPLTYEMEVTGASDELLEGAECIVQTVKGPDDEPLYTVTSCFNEQRGIVRSCVLRTDDEE